MFDRENSIAKFLGIDYFIRQKDGDHRDIDILEPVESRKKANMRYGSDLTVLSKDHVRALLSGKILALNINQGEYTQFVIMEEAFEK